MIAFDIKVERAFPKGKSSNLLYGGIYIGVFLFCFLFWIFLSDILSEDIYLAGEDYMPWFALILAVVSEIIIDRIMIATAGKILMTDDVAKIKKYGRMVSNYNENYWNGVRQLIVYEGLYAKFLQNETIRQQFLEWTESFGVQFDDSKG